MKLSNPFRANASASGLVPPGAHSTLSIGFVSVVMSFFAVLVLALALASGGLATSWQKSLADTATLQIIDDGTYSIEEQARAALNVLRSTPGIEGVRMIGVEEQRALLEPWLGPDVAMDNLPLPLLVEVSTDRSRLNVEGLKLRLAGEVPAATFDDHGALRSSLVVTATRLRIFAFVCLALLTGALALVLGLAAQAAVAANGQVIRTLRLVGAHDGFIVDVFTRRFVSQAFVWGGFGTLLGAGLIAVLPSASEPGFFLVGIGLQGWHWLLLFLIPMAVALAAWAATRLTVRRWLARLR
jgi:cell division transport system permease protein